MTKFSPYHRRLFAFLSVATFFEGYDFMAFSQILPNLRADMGLTEGQGGLIGSVIGIGTILAYALVRLADKWGRRRVLATTILGYALFTFLTGLSQTAYDFTLYQFIARVFLIAEWALSMVIAAEEYPAERRGFVLGVIQAFNSLGSITCAAIVPYLLNTAYGWRTVYFVGIIPLLLLAYARRGLRETARFAEYAAQRREARRSLTAIFRTPYRKRVVQLALIWGLTYICTNTAVLFWKEFAVHERGFTDAEVGRAVAIASLVALPFVFSVGKLLDAWGRKRGAMLIYSVGAVFVVSAYQLSGFWVLTACLMVAIFAAIALLALLNALTTELFPTEMRADAFAWANNLLGRIGYVIAPGVVGFAAGRIGWGNAV
nr:MFS transporter [Gemmatimonadales bacterium]NIN12868.1 MFS transporter [Gemmatimonadales bacterium]NIN51046.1 MFS transporter [Gemmatimonadales bacterium]NIP08510.1 MFS transporter [Gemmatimonadales bacterium]NIR02550.1 MFS transporter [Gemmatimonadales bacterium]